MNTYLSPQKPHLRWSLAAKEVCFSRPSHSLISRLGKVLPIVRGDGIYQPIMNQVLDELAKGDWLHIFPEGKVNEKKEFIRLKWGVGRLIADSKVTPIVLPFIHHGKYLNKNENIFLFIQILLIKVWMTFCQIRHLTYLK